MILLSIVIKTLNEEEKIVEAIRSARVAAARAGVSYEIIVADSLSTDRTVALAHAEGVRVVRFRRAEDCGCGAGVQLGFQYARGEWIYLMDGDMTLHPDFLRIALNAVQRDRTLGGVAGLLQDTRVHNDFDRIRVKNRLSGRIGDLPWLNAGGLYQRSAIADAGGYAGNINLKAYEEADLGMRLRASGWRLTRLAVPAARHTGHALGTWALLARHWRSRRAMAAGVLLRSAIGKPWWRAALRLFAHPLVTLAAWCAWAMAALLVPPSMHWPLLCMGVGGAAAVCLTLALRKRDLRHAVVSIAHWHYGAAAIVAGFFYRRRDTTSVIPAEELPALRKAQVA